jgi:replication-associated recombination protein RarA
MWDKTKTLSEQVTIGGYLVGDVLSALQKAIRRGNVRLACYWAAELFESGSGPHV